VQVQQLIDTGALVTWTEANGLEMVGATTAAVSVASASPAVSVASASPSVSAPPLSVTMPKAPPHGPPDATVEGNWGESAESYEEDESYESDESYEGLRRKETYGSDESYES